MTPTTLGPVAASVTVLSTELIPVDRLHQFSGNPRNGDVELIAESLRAHGQYRALVVNTRGGRYTILAGNHTYQGLLAIGATEALCHLVDLDDEQAKRVVLVDNRANDVSAHRYDEGLLASLLQSLPDLVGTGYGQDDLADLLERLNPTVPVQRTSPDDVPPVPEVPVSRPGDIWQLGPHRVLCGDSTDAQAVRRLTGGDRAALCMTDPPYGVNYAVLSRTHDNRRRGGWRDIENDAPEGAGLDHLLQRAFVAARDEAVRENAAWFCWHPPGENSQAFRNALAVAGVHVHKEIIWAKPHLVFGRWEYHWQHEPCMYGWQEGHHPEFYGERSETTLWNVTHDGGFKVRNGPAMASRGLGEHPTQKPTELWARAMRNHTLPGEAAYDAFAGSGPVVIAAHGLGRRAFAVELDPCYVDVIARRYQEHSGTVPILEATGEEHDFCG